MAQKNSFVSMMEQISKLNKNAVEIVSKLNDVTTSQKDNVSVNYQNSDGSQSQYQMPSVGKLQADIKKLNNDLRKIAGLEGETYVKDGETSKKVFSLDVQREPSEITSLDSVSNFSRGQNWFFETLMNPKLYVNLDLTDKIDDQTHQVLSRRYIIRFERGQFGEITPEGNTALQEFNNRFAGRNDIKMEEFHNWLQKSTIQNGVVGNTSLQEFKLNSVDEEIFDLNYKKIRYKGVYDVLKTENDTTNNKFWYHLNTLEYRGIDGSTKTLKKGDILNIKKQNSKYKIQEVSDVNETFKVRLERKEGYNPVPVGKKVLEYYSPYVSDKSINVTIGYDEYDVIFLKPIKSETNVISSLWSNGTSFYTNELILDIDNNQNLEDFYQNVEDHGKLLKDYIRRKVPASDGLQPNPVVLNEGNFKVVQINQHLTDNESSENLQSKISEKNTVRNDLETKREEIEKQNKRINTGEVFDIKTAREELNNLINQRDELTKELESLTKDITDILTTRRDNDYKFRVRGFFTIPAPRQGQEVIQFRVQYRYKNQEGNTRESQDYDVEGLDTTASFSNWIEYKTDIRERSYNPATRGWTWDNEEISNVNEPNINQIDIPIKNGEQVEFRVKAISEAGWPDTLIESNWSNTISIEFPQDKQNLVSQESINLINNTKDEALVEMNSRLNNMGVNRHVRDQYSEGDNFYAHQDYQIITPWTNNQMNFRDLNDVLGEMFNRITSLEEQLARTKGEIFVKLIDTGNNESYNLEPSSERKITVECEDYGDEIWSSGQYYREYHNNIYKITDFKVRFENVSQSNPLGLLSDRDYENTDQNTFFKHPSGQTLFVDEENNLHIQQDKQFIWFSDNHAGKQLNSGATYVSGDTNDLDNGTSSEIADQHLDILSSEDRNLGVVGGDDSVFYGQVNHEDSSTDFNNIISNIAWQSGTTDKFLATVHPEIDPLDKIQETSKEGIYTIKAGDYVDIPLNIYFRFTSSESDYYSVGTDLPGNVPKNPERKHRKVKFFIEKEGESRPFQYTIDFLLNRFKETWD